MKEDLKNIILAGIGSAAYTYEKGTGFLDEMVKKGKLTIDEGKELTEELKRTVRTKTANTSTQPEFVPLTKEDLISVLRDLNLPTKAEIDALKNRISELEEKILKNE